jgi:hypothetical protein
MSTSITPATAGIASDGRAGTPHSSLFHGSRPLKRWRYVAIFGEDLMACAAQVRIGPVRQCFWAILPRPGGRLRERTHVLRRRDTVELQHGHASGGRAAPGRLRIDDQGVLLDLILEEEAGIEADCPHGNDRVWTRKQAGIAASGTLSLDGGPSRKIRARAVIDDTAGYHARRTEWWWTAGVGEDEDGAAIAWNLVSGVNDPASGSERAVWVAGEPREAPPVDFTADLSRICCKDGSELRFLAEAERSRRENLLLVRSDYRAPFGTFSGALPGHITLARGLGVVEHHRALW